MARQQDDDRGSRGRGEERGFRYQRRSVDDVKKRASERSGNFDSFIKPDFKRYKIRDGKNIVRILPPTWDKPKHYAQTIYVNYRIGADNQSFLSLSEMRGERDPLAEARKEAQREGDKELAKALTPQKRSLMWVIDRLDEEEGPQIWDAPFGVDTDFVNLSIDEDTKEVIYVDDPDEGSDIRFYREAGKPYPKYPAAKMKIMPAGPLSEDKGQQKEWLQFVEDNPVPDCLQFYDYDHIAAAFDGVVTPRDDEDGGKQGNRQQSDDDKPRRSRSSYPDDEDDKDRRQPSRNARSSHADEDNDQDDDQEEDVKASRRPRQSLDHKGRGSDAEDDDDEEADNTDDDSDTEDETGTENRRPSIRERLQARRSKSRQSDDD